MSSALRSSAGGRAYSGRSTAGGATGQIFINYRRADSAGHARSLYDRLSGRFGAERLFMDDLAPGVDFVDHIHQALGSVDALVTVIGPRWLGETDTGGGAASTTPTISCASRS